MNHETCGRCGRKLKSEKSKQEGFGPVCLRKHVAAMAEAEQKQAEMNEYLEQGKND